MSDALPRMYGELADWFHLVTAPAEYAEEAGFYLRTLTDALGQPPRSLLELGSGGGNNASHYKRSLQTVVLTDLSEGMLNVSRQINPECEHIRGDMRTLRLDREFDVVFVHDAVVYLTTEDDLRQAMKTAYMHCRPGGAVLFAPDSVRELFQPESDHGGHDGAGRGLRYLEWTYDPDPSDSTYVVDFAYLLHEDGQPTRALYDHHVCGLFGRDVWLRLLGEVGFADARALPFEHSEEPPGSLEVFVARRLRPSPGYEATRSNDP